MKKYLILTSLLFSSYAFALSPIQALMNSPTNLSSYKDILNAVVTGHDIRIALDLSNCTLPDGNKASIAPFVLGIYTPNEVIISRTGNILASLTHFTMNDDHAKDKAVYQFARYKITPDNNVSLSMQVLAAGNYEALSGKITFVCPLGKGSVVMSR